MQCNSEFVFDEQWMKKTSQDLTLDFFWFFQKTFFSEIWAAKFRVRLICLFLQQLQYYPFIIQQIGNENIQTNQVEIVILI